MAGSGDSTGSQALDARAMRLANLSLALTTIIRHAPVSQSLLIELTGLKKPTVSSLVDELVRLGWVRIEGALPGKVGRPRQLLAPNPARGYVVSVQVSVDRLAVLVVDFAGTERARSASTVDVPALSAADAAGLLAELIARALDEAGARPGEVLGTALGLPGIVGHRGELRYAPGLDWDSAHVGTLLRAALAGVVSADAPLLVENEANLATVAEQRSQAARGVGSFVYLLGELGVGAGVVIDGRLFRGNRGAAGEVGHLSIAVDGRRCSCGKRGCWALYVNRDELVRIVREHRTAGHASSLWEDSTAPTGLADDLSLDRVVEAAREGDPVAGGALDRLRRYLAAGIGNLVSAYDPEVVVLGGFFTSAFAHDLDALRREVADWLMGSLYDGLRVELSTLGPDGSLRGGIALLLDHLASDPRAVPPLPVTV